MEIEGRKSKDDEWIKVPSKSRPGRLYMFSRTTGETKWCSSSNPKKNTSTLETIKETNENADSRKGTREVDGSPPRLTVKPLRTPAQDRLKRLQNSLKKSVNRSLRTSRQDKEAKLQENSKDSKDQQENRTEGSLPRSTTTQDIKERRPTTTPIKCKKRRLSLHLTPPSSPAGAGRLLRSNTPPPVATKVQRPSTPTNSPTPNKSPPHLPEAADSKANLFSNLGTGLINKIKKFYKDSFSSRRDDANDSATSSSQTLLSTTCFKKTSKTSKKKSIESKKLASAVQEALKELNTRQDEHKEYITLVNRNVPTYKRGSANARLANLRQSLLLQQASASITDASTSTSPDSSIAGASSSSPPASSPNIEVGSSVTNTSASLCSSTNTSLNEDCEPMDWQPTNKEEPTDSTDICSKTSSVATELTNTDCGASKSNCNEDRTVGEYYDTVNENLMRFAAETQKDREASTRKWKKDHYYFVVDTNVLIRHITFIEDLSKMKLCGTSGTILYVPYLVLQELDKLKMRSGFQEGVKTLAVRAIKYLNNMFESKNKHFQSQSALEERHDLIEVYSPDDSIINCCLQVKEHVEQVVLLTEDVNLRNKAISNNLFVSTKSDLVSKHEENTEHS